MPPYQPSRRLILQGAGSVALLGLGGVPFAAPALAAANDAPDLSWSTPDNVEDKVPYPLPVGDSDDDLMFIHRRDGQREIYFLSNQKHHGFDLKAEFRVAGKTPRLWHPDTGETEPVTYTTEQGRTTVPLHFDALGSVFVVFEGSGAAPSHTVPQPQFSRLSTVAFTSMSNSVP